MSSIIKHDYGKVTITTERLLLREAKREDITAMFEVLRDPKVMEYWSELPHSSLSRTTEWISDMIAGQQNGITDFILTLKDDDKAIGKMGIWQQEEIGFLLSRKHWLKGLAREALHVLLPYFSNEKGYETITADVDPDNQACLTLLKGVGFDETGFQEKTFQLDEKWVDSVYLSLSKSKWTALTRVAPLKPK